MSRPTSRSSQRSELLLRRQDSNLNHRNQNPRCCHYTTADRPPSWHDRTTGSAAPDSRHSRPASSGPHAERRVHRYWSSGSGASGRVEPEWTTVGAKHSGARERLLSVYPMESELRLFVATGWEWTW
jgi:hypothetical protein